MHHGSDDEDVKRLREQMLRELSEAGHKLGETGKYPSGKLTPKDEGEICFAVGSAEGKVVIDWGKPVAWVGMDRNQAIDLANLLKKHARRLGADTHPVPDAELEADDPPPLRSGKAYVDQQHAIDDAALSVAMSLHAQVRAHLAHAKETGGE